MVKFDHIFIRPYELQFLFFFGFFVPKTYFWKVLHGSSFIWVHSWLGYQTWKKKLKDFLKLFFTNNIY
jgi:hypothetical protein